MTEKHIWENGETITADLLNGMSDYADDKVSTMEPGGQPPYKGPVWKVNGKAPDNNGDTDLSYMARQDKANIFAESQSFRHGFTGGEIPVHSDLNDIGPGVWECMSNVNAKTLVNAPFGNQSFYMICMGTAGGYMVQIAYYYDGAEMAIRLRNPDAPVKLWYDWLTVSYDQKMNNGTVPDGTDIQTYKTAGRYGITGTAIINGPFKEKTYAMLEVDTLAGIIRQTITTMYGSIFINVYSGSPAVWQGWKKVTTTVA